MKKRFRVCWNEIYLCASEVEAENEQEAIRIAMSGEPGQREYGESEDAQAYEMTEDEE